MGPISPIPTIDRLRGFTLLEGLIASVLLAILALGVMGAVSSSYQQSEVASDNATAVTLDRQLLDEINSKPFNPSDTLGPISGARSTYVNISAYNEYTDQSNAVPMLKGGAPLDVTGSEAYSRQVAVVPGAQPTINGVADTTSPTSDFAIVTVNVTCPDGLVVSIPEFVADYPINQP